MSDLLSPEKAAAPDSAPSLRLDKWLWHARVFKTRSLATRFCGEGRIRIGGRVVDKAHYAVRPGDVLTFAHGHDVKVLKVVALGTRRGPAPEARTLYEDLSTPRVVDPVEASPAQREPGSGRPTKADRRALERLTGSGDEG
ncbi:MAG: RNA-binding S4 domain-containing protein [Rhodospirillaceae bacterium]|nr:RNA-binding S4 domain-containing protein [Rhodospirillaceae bacterium]